MSWPTSSVPESGICSILPVKKLRTQSINIDFEGLKTAIIDMLSGAEVPVNVNTFQNDMVNFRDRDDVLTLLIHLGYLAFHQETQSAYIPNEEIRMEMLNAVRVSKWDDYMKFQQDSQELLDAVLDKNASEVADRIGKIHDTCVIEEDYNSAKS